MIKIHFILLFLSSLIGCNDSAQTGQFNIKWVDDLTGDYTFTNDWSYPEGVFINDFGQVDCDGFCPERIRNMKDLNGKILLDSLQAFYTLVDTTHLYHTMQCEAQTYEWSGCDYINAVKTHGDSIKLKTITNAGTHSSLQISIIHDKCIPIIELISITGGRYVYNCSNGSIIIDKKAYEQGLIKAIFDFNFRDPDHLDIKMFWKGKICTRIQ